MKLKMNAINALMVGTVSLRLHRPGNSKGHGGWGLAPVLPVVKVCLFQNMLV